jgi:hypothetical protein
MTEDLLSDGLLIEGGESNVMSFGDSVKSLEIVGILMRIQSFDQSIEDSVPNTQRFHATVDSGLSRQGGLAIDSSFHTALASLLGIGAAGTRASYSSFLAAIAAHQRSSP